MTKPSQQGNQKKNKGGRPRKNESATSGSTSLTWKRLSQPASTHHYEVSSQGAVRRLLKNGNWYNVKPWVTGGPYAAVYIYGVKGATRGRKKVYVHRLVAQHFVKGKRPGNVVHHKVGPANNSANALEWVTPSENANARKYFTDDGKRKTKAVKPQKKVKVNVPKPLKQDKKPVEPKEKPPPPEPKAPPPKPVNKEKKVHTQKHNNKKLPSDPDEYYPQETFNQKIKYLYNEWPPFKKAWIQFKLRTKKIIGARNFQAKFREATKKKFKVGDSPASWYTRIISGMHEIERRLES